jgi:hypothetical protein
MTENAKTITFVVVGLLAIAIGLATRPSSAELDEQTLVGAVLTKDFDTPEEAKRLKIVRFNEDTATLREFEVAEQDGLWSIPSKDGYPADAARQMAEAATSLMDRKILHVASKNAGDHEEYGVVDPLSPKLEVGQKGVGTRVTMRDIHNEPLADLIVGKAVKDAEGQRYVREAGRDIVYVIEIDPAKLSTNFEDWIEKDLLKLNSWDLQQVEIKDYSAELTPVMTQQGLRFQLAGDMRSEMTLAYNDSDAKWNAVKLRRFDPQTEAYTDFTLAEDEELNTETLNGLKTALDDLQIVDVVRKPQGLSNDLKAGEDFMKNEEALRDLVSKGFTPTQSASGTGPDEIISSDGEIIATMKNGTEYVLRFGNLTNVGAGDKSSETEQPAAASDAASEATKDGGVHRYLFAMARFNENAVKRPELQDPPKLPSKEEQPASGEATSTSGESGEDASAEGSATADASNSDGNEGTEASDTQAGAPAENGNAADETADTTADAAAADQPATPPADAKSNETAANDSNAAAGESEKKDDAPASADTDEDQELKKLIADRDRIEQENKRKLEEYQQTLEKGRENVKELNLRFGDWYFVVADDVFKKIRLSRESVIKKKEKKLDTEKSDAADSSDTAAPTGLPAGLPPIPGASQ